MWFCLQLGAREHYSIPRALSHAGRLGGLFTDAWVLPGSLWRLAGRRLRERFHRDLRNSPVTAWNRGLAAFEIDARLRKLSGWPLIIERNNWFQSRTTVALKAMASVAQQGVGRPIVFSYSYTAQTPFQLARRLGWATVLGQIDPGPPEERIVGELGQNHPAYAGGWEPAPPSYWSAWREECNLADVIVVNSQWSQSALVAEGIAREKIIVVPLAFDRSPNLHGTNRQYPAVFSRPRPLRVLFLGQAILRKGIQDLVTAAKLLLGQPVVFEIVGPHGQLPASLPENVTFHGAVPRSEAVKWYQRSDLFVLPTHSDGFALTQLEAMVQGLPVIATSRCGEVVQMGRSGWLIEPGSPEQLAHVIGSVLADPDILPGMSEAALQRSRDFSLKRLTAALGSIDTQMCPGP